MNSKSPNLPPRYLLKLFKWFCKPDYHDDIEGDLLELYIKRVRRISEHRANVHLLFDIILLFRPGIIRPLFSLNPYINYPDMFRHNLLISLRSFLRNRTTFFINLVGLSIGMTSVLLIYFWIDDELQVDQFHKNGDRLFQVVRNIENNSGIQTTTFTPGILAQSLKEEYSIIEDAVSVVGSQFSIEGVLSHENNHVKALERYAGANFFKLFSYPIISGNVNTLLSSPKEVVISQKLATKLFGSADEAIGKKVRWNRKVFFGDVSGLYQVSGVFSMPTQSSENFDLVFSIDLYNDFYLKESGKLWQNNSTHTFVLVPEDINIIQANEELAHFLSSKTMNYQNAELALHKFVDTYLYGKYENGKQVGGRIRYLLLFSLIALFILLIASINFVNLFMARASRRIKEFGIKNVIGANRSIIIGQVLCEAILVGFVSTFAALLFLYIILPSFNQFTGKELALDLFDPQHLLFMLGMCSVTGLAAGLYPALYLSKFKPAHIIKNKYSVSTKGNFFSKGLVVFQFVISTILIVGVIATAQQMDMVFNKNLGYIRSNIIMIEREGDIGTNFNTFLSDIQEIPGVVKTSSINFALPGKSGSFDGLDWKGKDPSLEISFDNLEVGYGLLELLEIKIIEGRAFTQQDIISFRGDGDIILKIVINESAVKAMGIEDPIGKIIRDGNLKMEIIGIAKDFNYSSLYEEIRPMLIRFVSMPEFPLKYGLVKIAQGTEHESLQQISTYYEQANAGLELKYTYLDESYRKIYQAEERVAVLSRYFAGLAILISCLGLFGLTIFILKQREKEISIRKILGANIFELLHLLTMDFTKMILISLTVGLPIGYFLIIKWLENFAYTIDIQWWFFLGTAALLILIAWLTIGAQALKTAKLDPVESLRTE